jgi:uncharacterized alkaline shock family protein YloU/adenylate kinase family enzyme
MKIVALVGKSGTGKSYHAINLAYEYHVDYIIDDGLLIRGNKIIAGKSAKREATSVGAVKRALFTHEDHRMAVKNKIKEIQPNGILILGTSKRMVDKIAYHLGIDPVQQYVYIEEITTDEERKIAQKQRNELGKHIIPVPTFEIKKDFSGYFIDPLKILRRKKDDTVHISEKSVVRPTYSYMGKYVISDKVIVDLVYYAGKDLQGVYKISKVDVLNYSSGVVIRLNMVMVYGNQAHVLAKELQKRIKKEVEYMTLLNILTIDIVVKKIVLIS